LFDTMIRQFLYLLDYRFGRTGHFRPANIGYDTIRAEIVAAPHDPYKCLGRDRLVIDAVGRFEFFERPILLLRNLPADFLRYCQAFLFFL